jgi:hypothetical protein
MDTGGAEAVVNEVSQGRSLGFRPPNAKPTGDLVWADARLEGSEASRFVHLYNKEASSRSSSRHMDASKNGVF